MIEITLALHEVNMVRGIGAARQESAVESEREDFYGFGESGNDDPLAIHVNGAGGELAASFVYKLPWSGCYYRSLKPKPADIGFATEVRTRSKHWHDLIVHPEDHDDWMHVLVIGELPTYKVIGSIAGWRAKRDEWWADPAGNRPAFFVPQEELRQV